MKKLLVVATAGIFLLSLEGARAQKEVQPPPVPPLLESPRPLAQPETKEPATPKKTEGEKAATTASPKAKTGKKSSKQARAQTNGNKKKTAKANKKQAKKAAKKKPPVAEPKPQLDEGPGEG